jgi:hypothetical protein
MQPALRLLLLLPLLLAFLASDCRAMFIGVETENVPVERVLRNLQVRLEADPSNAELHYQVARLHALASVRSPQSLLPVYKASRPERADAYIKSREGFPYYGGGDGSGVPDEVKRRPHDAAHLAKAIEHYETAMALMRANPSASSVRSILLRTQLGHAWCLARAGRRDEAIASYRLVLEVAWTKEILIPRGNSDLSWSRRFHQLRRLRLLQRGEHPVPLALASPGKGQGGDRGIVVAIGQAWWHEPLHHAHPRPLGRRSLGGADRARRPGGL